MGQAVLLVVLVLGTSVWVGGYVAIGVVARSATTTLEPEQRVRFFRSLGRSYLWVGTPALVLALLSAAVLARHQPRDAALVCAVVLAVLLVVLLAVAVRQARRMTRLRRRVLTEPEEAALVDRVRRGDRSAGILRGLLGVLSLALVVLGCFIAT